MVFSPVCRISSRDHRPIVDLWFSDWRPHLLLAMLPVSCVQNSLETGLLLILLMAWSSRGVVFRGRPDLLASEYVPVFTNFTTALWTAVLLHITRLLITRSEYPSLWRITIWARWTSESDDFLPIFEGFQKQHKIVKWGLTRCLLLYGQIKSDCNWLAQGWCKNDAIVSFLMQSLGSGEKKCFFCKVVLNFWPPLVVAKSLGPLPQNSPLDNKSHIDSELNFMNLIYWVNNIVTNVFTKIILQKSIFWVTSLAFDNLTQTFRHALYKTLAIFSCDF